MFMPLVVQASRQLPQNAKFLLMRTFVNGLLVVALVGLGVLAQEKAPPEKLVFMTKNGNVTFNHADHIKRVKGDCSTCHDELFQKSATAAAELQAEFAQDGRNGQDFVRSLPSRGWCSVRVQKQLREVPHEGVKKPTRESRREFGAMRAAHSPC
jgi:hypothetical protein